MENWWFPRVNFVNRYSIIGLPMLNSNVPGLYQMNDSEKKRKITNSTKSKFGGDAT